MATNTKQTSPSMRDSDEALDYFTAAMDELISAKFILAERRIPDVLKTIAYFRKLFVLFETALDGYNHRAEFAAAVVTEKGRRTLRLPKNRTKAAAFGFSILYDIDTERLSLRELTEQYFYHSDPTRQYRNFVNDFLLPWRDTVEFVYRNGIQPPIDEQPVDTSLQTAAAQIAHEIKLKLNTNDILAETKQEVVILLDGILLALTPNRLDLLRALLIGLKSLLFSSLQLKDATAPLLTRFFRLFTSMNLL